MEETHFFLQNEIYPIAIDIGSGKPRAIKTMALDVGLCFLCCNTLFQKDPIH